MVSPILFNVTRGHAQGVGLPVGPNGLKLYIKPQVIVAAVIFTWLRPYAFVGSAVFAMAVCFKPKIARVIQDVMRVIMDLWRNCAYKKAIVTGVLVCAWINLTALTVILSGAGFFGGIVAQKIAGRIRAQW